jgi:hypothetical protein
MIRLTEERALRWRAPRRGKGEGAATANRERGALRRQSAHSERDGDADLVPVDPNGSETEYRTGDACYFSSL